MDDPSEQLRRHYDAQSLSSEATERILAAAEASRRKPRYVRRVLFAVAAAVAIAIAGYSFHGYTKKVEVAQIETSVQSFFSQPTYDLDRASTNRDELRSWLVQHGAPAEAEIPPGLAPLPSVGCKVLSVGRQYAYVLCMQTSSGGAKSMPGKGPAPMMKGKGPTLIHLVIVRTSALRDVRLDSLLRTETRDGWTFATSEHQGVTYVIATTLDRDQLEAILREA